MSNSYARPADSGPGGGQAPQWRQPKKKRGRPGPFGVPTRVMAAGSALLLTTLVGLPAVAPASAAVAPLGAGFTVTASDLAFILKQIKIAEAHVANTTSATGPCGALIGNGPNQVPDAITTFGLRTVDGSCNNLLPGRETYGAADQTFPRLTKSVFGDAESAPALGQPAATTYAQKTGDVFDTRPREISNLIVDQTSTNPSAVNAAGFPVRTQGNVGKFPCTTDPDPLATPVVEGVPAGCVPTGDTLFIPNVTTDVGLSPPYNSMFTLFGQFFDHGVDQTVKGGATVYVPLKADDPLRTVGPDAKPNTGDEVPANQAFMVLTRAQNQPGPDGILGNADDIQDAVNTDSPYVDQSQTYTSHASHQVFLREYVNNTAVRPVATGKLLGGPAGPNAGGMATWARVKSQAATLLGLRLTDRDVTDVPQLAVDPYGKFIPGPLRGLPQYVTPTGLVEGNKATPVPVPANAVHFNTPFLTDIAHNADPSPRDTDHNPATPAVVPVPDTDTTASADFAAQPAGTYDDEMLDAHFTAGDGRVNENIGLTAIHQVFHSEHDRLVDDIKNTLTTDTTVKGVAALAEWKATTGAAGWNGERLFQAARFVTEMEYQHLVFEEFGRKIQPAIQPFHIYHSDLNPAVKAEFAHAVYRFGHSMLTETIARTNGDGSDNSIPLLKGFLNPPEYTNSGTPTPLTSEQAAGSLVMGMSDQAGNELDEFVTGTLRNNLLGLPLDLATINLTRAREAGVPPLNELRRQIHDSTGDGQLAPYTSWADFGQNLKHPESLINFVAAYGTYPTITAATTAAAKRAAAKALVDPGAGVSPTAEALDFINSAGAYANTETGLNKVDLWIGGLAEKTNLFGGLLGSTFNYVFENQMTDLQNGDRFYYLARTPGMNLRAALESNSFAEMIMRNTEGTHTLKADVFATSDCKFQLSNLAGTPEGYLASGGPVVADDPASECNENLLLLRKPDGTIQYKEKNTVDPSGINGQSVYNGTAAVDRVTGGNDNDTFWGGDGNDVIEGQGGDDVALGGEGDDRMTDLAGDDVTKGGPGDDYVNGGIGLDIVMSGDGQDFTNGGANDNETFAGEGNDFVQAGDGSDAVFGGGGDDWIQGGTGQDLLIGDHGAPFFDDPAQTKPGNDVFTGQVGENDYDAEGGDDIMSSNSAVDRYASAGGFDWANHQYDTVGADDDMNINRNLLGLNLPAVVNRDRWQETEANSGSAFNDIIRGDDVVPSAQGGGGFTGCDALDQAGIDRIAGLGDILPAPTTPLAPVEAASAPGACPLTGPVWGDGNILLGGLGSDVLEGRGADDVLDGDRYLKVRISVRNDAGSEIGTTDLMEHTYQTGNTKTLAADVAAGIVDPGNLVIVRELVAPTAADATGTTDTAVFSDVRANYTVTTTGGIGILGSPGSVTTVNHNGGADGIDTLRNIESIVFADTVAPSAPLIGAAVGGNASATVNWIAPATGIATSYAVKVVNAAGVQVGALRAAPAGTTSLVITGLTNGTAYRFQVSATNEVGTSAFSALSNAVTPAVPLVLQGAARIGTVTAANASATVNWLAPLPVTNAAPVTSYRVRAFAGTTLVRTQVAPATATSLLVTGLTNGTAYTFDVAAVNSVGTGPVSARSAAATPRTEFVAPTVTARTPASAARSVSQTGNVLATFSEGVTGVSATTFVLRSGTTVVPATVTYNATTRVATLNPTATLVADRTYPVSLTAGIRDTAGNPLVASTRTFTTGPVPTFTITSGTAGVRRTANATATFSEPVTGVSGTTVRLSNVASGATISAVVSYNATTRVMTVNPSVTLGSLTQYRVTVGSVAGIRDTAGNPLVARSWIFTTGSVL